MNPDLLICHLDEGATLNMELTADVGKGYVPAAANRPADAPIGLVSVDALYAPVKQVAYKVENTRVGQELDYDKLTLTVETDGTITPDDAVAYAARILQDQLALFVHFDDAASMSQGSPIIGMAASGGGMSGAGGFGGQPVSEAGSAAARICPDAGTDHGVSAHRRCVPFVAREQPNMICHTRRRR